MKKKKNVEVYNITNLNSNQIHFLNQKKRGIKHCRKIGKSGDNFENVVKNPSNIKQ